VAIALDLVSKYVAFHHVAGVPVHVVRDEVLVKSAVDPRLVTTVIPKHDPVVVIPSVLEFTLVLNPGAVFGIGPGQRWFFIGFTLMALVFGIGMFLKWTTARDTWAHLGIAMLLGGGLGNLYDRLTYACVRDFIHPLPGLEWPFGWAPLGSRQVWPYVSNVADLILLIGIGILLVILWRKDKAK
jgi:signal peptidase II